jgi:hypothetical protein
MSKRILDRVRVRSCLVALFLFYVDARRVLSHNQQLSMGKIADSLLFLLKEVSGVDDIETAKRKIYFTNCEYKDDQNDCVCVNMNGTIFEITQANVRLIVDAIDELRKDVAMNLLCEKEDEGKFVHFKFIAEERDIRTDFIYTREGFNHSCEFFSEKDLLRNACKSMEDGLCEIEASMDITLRSKQHRFFIVEPVSNFGKQVLRCKYEQDNHKTQSMRIPDVWHDSWLNLGTIVASILVHYHLAYGDFRRVKQCGTCGDMFLEARIDTSFCSKRCRQLGWARKEGNATYEMIKCRERQKQFFNYDEKIQLQWLKEDCVGCSREPLPPGGQCTRWNDKFGETEIERRLKKRDESW